MLTEGRLSATVNLGSDVFDVLSVSDVHFVISMLIPCELNTWKVNDLRVIETLNHDCTSYGGFRVYVDFLYIL